MMTISYPLSIIHFQNHILEEEEELALEVLPKIDSQFIDKISEFL